MVNWIDLLLMMPAALFAPAIHEWTKARVSATLGDPTPKNRGLLTWNPFRYFEPVGFFFMLVFQVGWGRPVPTTPLYYKDKRKGVILTYTAPIVANLLVGMLAAFLWSLFSDSVFSWAIGMYNTHGTTWLLRAVPYLHRIIVSFYTFNISLAVFNLIPVYPLAGNKLLQVFVSPETSVRMNHYEKPMQVLLIILLFFELVQELVFPVRSFLLNLVLI